MILTHLEDNRKYDDDYIIKIPKSLYNDDDAIFTVINDIDSYGPGRKGFLIIDEPHKYLNKLVEFYGNPPPDVDSNSFKTFTKYEDSASNKIFSGFL